MKDPAGLGDFKIPLRKLAPLTIFRTRGGEERGYRLYPAWSENLLVLIHGVGGDSRYLAAAAHAIAGAGIATVVTPDLRGHGTAPHGPRASAATPSQLEQDLEETLIHVRLARAFTKIVWGGHSLGAALAGRLALEGDAWTAGLLLIAPMLPESAGASGGGADFGGWLAKTGEGVIRVNMPEFFRTGTEVLEYDESFFRAAAPPDDFVDRIDESGLKTRVLLAEGDQVFDAAASERYFAGHPRIGVFKVRASHLGIVGVSDSLEAIVNLAEELFS